MFQESAMIELNRFQRKRLPLALEYRGKTVSLLTFFLSGWKFYAVFLLIFGGGAMRLWPEERHTWSALLVGFV
jgi:hypothetical protein